MGAYLCIAYNGVPPSVSKRITLIVHCKYQFIWADEKDSRKTLPDKWHFDDFSQNEHSLFKKGEGVGSPDFFYALSYLVLLNLLD